MVVGQEGDAQQRAVSARTQLPHTSVLEGLSHALFRLPAQARRHLNGARCSGHPNPSSLHNHDVLWLVSHFSHFSHLSWALYVQPSLLNRRHSRT